MKTTALPALVEGNARRLLVQEAAKRGAGEAIYNIDESGRRTRIVTIYSR